MKKILLGIGIIGILGSCANWEDTKKDWDRRIMIDNAIVIIEEK